MAAALTFAAALAGAYAALDVMVVLFELAFRARCALWRQAGEQYCASHRAD